MKVYQQVIYPCKVAPKVHAPSVCRCVCSSPVVVTNISALSEKPRHRRTYSQTKCGLDSIQSRSPTDVLFRVFGTAGVAGKLLQVSDWLRLGLIPPFLNDFCSRVHIRTRSCVFSLRPRLPAAQQHDYICVLRVLVLICWDRQLRTFTICSFV